MGRNSNLRFNNQFVKTWNWRHSWFSRKLCNGIAEESITLVQENEEVLPHILITRRPLVQVQPLLYRFLNSRNLFLFLPRNLVETSTFNSLFQMAGELIKKAPALPMKWAFYHTQKKLVMKILIYKVLLMKILDK